MYNDRPREAVFEKIAFCLVGVATPNELIKDWRTTPYNIAGRSSSATSTPSATTSARSTGRWPMTPRLVRCGKGSPALDWWHPYLTAKRVKTWLSGERQPPEAVERLIEKLFPNLEGARSEVHFEMVLRFIYQRRGRPTGRADALSPHPSGPQGAGPDDSRAYRAEACRDCETG
jgi:hypothetical protein